MGALASGAVGLPSLALSHFQRRQENGKMRFLLQFDRGL